METCVGRVLKTERTESAEDGRGCGVFKNLRGGCWGRRGGRAQLRSSQDRGKSWTSSKSLQGVRMGVGRLLGGLIDARAVG